MAIDWTQFFNPSAWGSFAPGQQGMINPQVQGAAGAPQPSGAIGPPANPPASILGGSGAGGPPAASPASGGASPISSLLSSVRAQLGGGGASSALGPTTGWTPSGSPGPTGNIGYGTGVGPTGPIPASPPPNPSAGGATNPLGGSSQNWNNMMQKVGMSMLQPQAAQPQPLQMAKPVGPGQLPPPNASAGQMGPWGQMGMQGIAGWGGGMPGMLNRFGF